MHFSHRKERILSELIKTDTYVTSSHLAQQAGVSARTIREDMKELANELARRDIILHALPSKGYRIAEGDQTAVRQYLDEIVRVQSRKPVLPVERQQYILHQLLFGDERVVLRALREKLFVSESTLEKDLQEVANWLRENHVILQKDTESAFIKTDSEMAFRYAMGNFYATFLQGEAQIDIEDLGSVLAVGFIGELAKALRELHAADSIHISQAAFSNLLLYLAVSASRLAKGHTVHIDPKEIPALASQKEYTLALNSLKAVEEAAGIRFPESEVIRFCKVLMQANIISVDQSNVQAIADARILTFVNKIVFKIQTHFGLDLVGDRKFINSLVLYLRSRGLKEDQLVMHSALKITEIEKAYPRATEITMLISSDLKKELALHLSEAEISELALFVCAAIERNAPPIGVSKIRVVIICAAGKGGSQLIAAKIERSFMDLEILGVFPIYRLSEAEALKPDLILSTIPFDATGLTCLQINPLLTERDETVIREEIRKLRNQADRADGKALLDLLDAELFFPQVDLHSPESVIEWMGSQLRRLGIVDDDFTPSVLDRESLSPTSLGNLVAIPHAFLQQTDRACIAVAILKNPIQWGSEKAQLVFLLNISTSQEADFKPIFTQLYGLISDRKKVQRLIRTTEFISFLKELNG